MLIKSGNPTQLALDLLGLAINFHDPVYMDEHPDYTNLGLHEATLYLGLNKDDTEHARAILTSSGLFTVQSEWDVESMDNPRATYPYHAAVWATKAGIKAYFSHMGVRAKEPTALPSEPVSASANAIPEPNLLTIIEGTLTADEFHAFATIMTDAVDRANSTPMLRKESNAVYSMFKKLGILPNKQP